jgi:CRISPR/Cas system CMR subunit Cmr4 (Cas7 group RAMP superfamily)
MQDTNSKTFKFYLAIVIGLIFFIIVDQIRIHYKDKKLDEIKDQQQKLVETQLNKDIHLLNKAYKDNQKLYETRESTRVVEQNKLFEQNAIIIAELKKQKSKGKSIQYKIDSIDKDLFLPNPYNFK